MELYPLTYAAVCLAGLEDDEDIQRESVYWDDWGYSYLSPSKLKELAKNYWLLPEIFRELTESLCVEKDKCRVGLVGYWWNNPFNALEPEWARFPKNAYLEWWNRKPRGMPLPEWFSDLAQETHEAMPQPKPEASGATEIIDGLTVADVRRMCERSGALASVLRAVAQWQAIEKENPERMTTDVLLSKLKIAARKDGWGTDKGELAKSQKEQLQKMILDKWRPGGRPRKNSND